MFVTINGVTYPPTEFVYKLITLSLSFNSKLKGTLKLYKLRQDFSNPLIIFIILLSVYSSKESVLKSL